MARVAIWNRKYERVIIVNRATVSVFRPSNFAADVVFSAAGLGPLVEIWYRLKKWIFDPYRPELHYMRGPGPKWREKHAHGGLSRSMSHQQEDCTSAEQDLRRTPAAIATSRADLCRSPNPKEEVGLQHPI